MIKRFLLTDHSDNISLPRVELPPNVKFDWYARGGPGPSELTQWLLPYGTGGGSDPIDPNPDPGNLCAQLKVGGWSQQTRFTLGTTGFAPNSSNPLEKRVVSRVHVHSVNPNFVPHASAHYVPSVIDPNTYAEISLAWDGDGLPSPGIIINTTFFPSDLWVAPPPLAAAGVGNHAAEQVVFFNITRRPWAGVGNKAPLTMSASSGWYTLGLMKETLPVTYDGSSDNLFVATGLLTKTDLASINNGHLSRPVSLNSDNSFMLLPDQVAIVKHNNMLGLLIPPVDAGPPTTSPVCCKSYCTAYMLLRKDGDTYVDLVTSGAISTTWILTDSLDPEFQVPEGYELYRSVAEFPDAILATLPPWTDNTDNATYALCQSFCERQNAKISQMLYCDRYTGSTAGSDFDSAFGVGCSTHIVRPTWIRPSGISGFDAQNDFVIMSLFHNWTKPGMVGSEDVTSAIRTGFISSVPIRCFSSCNGGWSILYTPVSTGLPVLPLEFLWNPLDVTLDFLSLLFSAAPFLSIPSDNNRRDKWFFVNVSGVGIVLVNLSSYTTSPISNQDGHRTGGGVGVINNATLTGYNSINLSNPDYVTSEAGLIVDYNSVKGKSNWNDPINIVKNQYVPTCLSSTPHFFTTHSPTLGCIGPMDLSDVLVWSAGSSSTSGKWQQQMSQG